MDAFLRSHARIFFVLLWIFPAMLAHAQVEAVEPTHPRPRIGLALSGGGALGLAQAGVIQWMEEHHIPVDRIGGTSMGAIIASMYATGASPSQIEQFAEAIDWDAAFLPEPVYRQLSYRRKQDSSLPRPHLDHQGSRGCVDFGNVPGFFRSASAQVRTGLAASNYKPTRRYPPRNLRAADSQNLVLDDSCVRILDKLFRGRNKNLLQWLSLFVSIPLTVRGLRYSFKPS